MLRVTFLLAALLSMNIGATAHESLSFGTGKKAEPSDRAKIVERLRGRYQDVLDQLNQKNPGADTLAKQKEIADLLKQLLEQDDPPASNPSPPAPKATNPPPSGEAQPMPKPTSNTSATEQSARSLNELKKQLEADGHWPVNLPPHHRKSLDSSAHGRFMPRYEELLRAYYRTIAESSDRKDDK